MRASAILQYSGSSSIQMKSRPSSFAIFPVVPLPMNGSRMVSPGLLHDMMWSCASVSGNCAGWHLFLFDTSVFMCHTLNLCHTVEIDLCGDDIGFVVQSACRTHQCFLLLPALLFVLSFIGLNVQTFPFEKMNMYSKTCAYRVFSAHVAVKVCFSHIIVSCKLNQISFANNACLNDVPVSDHSLVSSDTTHTTNPPCFVTRKISLSTPFQTCSPHSVMFPL